MPLTPHGLGQLADQVASGVPPGQMRVRDAGGPQAPSVGVLGHQDHVAGPGGGEAGRPPVGIPPVEAGHEVGGERAVGAVSPDLPVVARRRTAREAEGVLVPLDVGRVREGVGLAPTPAARRSPRRWCVGRDRGRGPVDEDPELGVPPPGRGPTGPQPGQRRSGRCHGGDPTSHRRIGAGPPTVGRSSGIGSSLQARSVAGVLAPGLRHPSPCRDPTSPSRASVDAHLVLGGQVHLGHGRLRRPSSRRDSIPSRRGRPRSTPGSPCSTPPRSTGAGRASGSSARFWPTTPTACARAVGRHQVHALAVEARRARFAARRRCGPRSAGSDCPSVDLYQIHGPISLRSHAALGRRAGRRPPGRGAGPVGRASRTTRSRRPGRWPGALRVARDALATNQIEFSLPAALAGDGRTPGRLRRPRRASRWPTRPIGQGRLTGKYSAANPPPGKRTFSNHPMEVVDAVVAELRRIGDEHGGKLPSQVALNWVDRQGCRPHPRGQEPVPGRGERRRPGLEPRRRPGVPPGPGRTYHLGIPRSSVPAAVWRRSGRTRRRFAHPVRLRPCRTTTPSSSGPVTTA